MLPGLPYGYNELEPHISEEQLTVHHQKHHHGYVKKSNAIMEKIEKSREEKTKIDMAAALKSLSFNLGGHILHSLFWNNMKPPAEEKNEPAGKIAEIINEEFGSFEKFKEEFSQASAIEGSGWVGLSYCKLTEKPILLQIEKHNVNHAPTCKPLLVLDLWEHAYYLDYKNKKAEFIEGFWNIVNWKKVNERLENFLK